MTFVSLEFKERHYIQCEEGKYGKKKRQIHQQRLFFVCWSWSMRDREEFQSRPTRHSGLWLYWGFSCTYWKVFMLWWWDFPCRVLFCVFGSFGRLANPTHTHVLGWVGVCGWNMAYCLSISEAFLLPLAFGNGRVSHILLDSCKQLGLNENGNLPTHYWLLSFWNEPLPNLVTSWVG